MTQHTSFPWTIAEEGYIEDDYYAHRVFSISEARIAPANCYGETPEEAEAHARLVAAAPDLLAALEAFDRGLYDGSIKFTKTRQSDDDPYHPANTLMCTAFSKVRGEA